MQEVESLTRAVVVVRFTVPELLVDGGQAIGEGLSLGAARDNASSLTTCPSCRSR